MPFVGLLVVDLLAWHPMLIARGASKMGTAVDESPTVRHPSLELAQAAHLQLERGKAQMTMEFLRRNYLNVMGPKLPPPLAALRTRVFKLRDSIGYRATSVMWHLQMMHGRRETLRRRFETSVEESITAFHDPVALLRHWHHQFFLLDDVIFNALSLYDYLGGLIAVLWHLSKHKYQWDHIARHCKKTPAGFDPVLAELVVRTHADWVKALQRYRGHVIHREALLGPNDSAFNLDSLTLTWSVWLPPELQVALRRTSGGDRIEVVDGACEIVIRAFESAGQVLQTLGDTCPWSPDPRQ